MRKSGSKHPVTWLYASQQFLGVGWVQFETTIDPIVRVKGVKTAKNTQK